jgi:O-acetyl-ADP-ribose deacetylase (regulator of RNase III)
MININLIQANITQVNVDVIVNAANSSLLGGGGVDGAIHRAAGRKLAIACLQLGGCKVGKAKMTESYNIKTAQKIVHTVGPVYKGMDDKTEAERLLISCFQESLKIGEGYKTIAFPFISTGIYGYPLDKAILAYVKAIKEYEKANIGTSFQEVMLIAYSVEEYNEALKYFREE